VEVGSLDSHDVPQLSLEGYAYVGIIVLAFCALATQKLVHYPLGFMAVAGMSLFILRRSDARHTSTLMLLLLFTLLWLPMCLSSIDAVAMKHSLLTTVAYFHFLPAAYFIIHACSRPGVYFWLQKWVLWLIMFIIFDALLQFFSGYNLMGYPYLGRHKEVGDAVLTGFFYPKERLALILSVLFPIVLHYFKGARLKIFPYLILLPSYLFVILMTFKRSAWVMLAVGASYLLVFALLKRNVFKSFISMKLILILVFAVLIAIVSGSILSDRLSKNLGFFSGDLQQVDVASNYRISLWKTGYEIFKDKPLLGIGPRGFRHVYEEYSEADNFWLQDGRRGQTHPHSNIVEVFVETGVLGFVGYLLLYGYFIFRFFSEKFFSDSFAWSLTVLIVWCPLNTHLAFYGSYWSSFAWMLVSISLASFRLQQSD
jgi:O-antigen ligase